MTVERCLRGRIEWDASIDYDVLPTAILEELEHSESVFKTIVDYQVLKKLTISGES